MCITSQGYKCKLELYPYCKIYLNARVLKIQILISLSPFQNMQAYVKFQWMDEGVHRETKLFSILPSIFKVKRLSL